MLGFDIERHQYGEQRYPGQLVIQDVLTLHGSQFRNADMIVASPPCQRYSYMAMPFSRGKREAAWQRWERDSPFGNFRLNDLFNACFRIQREASEAAGHHVPMVVENVKGAQPWVGSARWHFGSFYLWGDVPAIMPPVLSLRSVSKNRETQGGTWFNVAHGQTVPGNQAGAPQRGDGLKTVGHVNQRNGHDHTRHLTNQAESERVLQGQKVPGIKLSDVGFNVAAAQLYREGLKGPGGDWFVEGKQGQDACAGGVKQRGSGPEWFDQGIASHSSRSDSRKAASAMIAKIPAELAQYVARYYKP